jgi:hypothetical protein
MADDKGWEDVPETEIEAGWEDVPEEEEVSALDALRRGVEQGASLGFSDEIRGALGAMGAMDTPSGAPYGVDTGSGTGESPIDAYRAARDTERAYIEKVKEERPGTFLAGEVASALIPMGGVAKGAKGLLSAGTKALGKQGIKEATKQHIKQSIPMAKQGAIASGVASGGYSETDVATDPAKLASEVAMGAGMGALAAPVVPAVTKSLAAGAKKAGQLAKSGGKKVTKVLSGLREGTMDDVLKYADELKNVKDYPEIQEIIVNKTRGVFSDIGKASREANKYLSNEKFLPKDELIERIAKRMDKIDNTADESASPYLQKIINHIKDKTNYDGELLSQKDLHSIVQDTGKRAYTAVSKTAEDAPRVQLRQVYNELSTYLKGMAPKEFESKMDKIHQRYNMLEKLEKKLGIEVKYEDVILKSEDSLINKLQQVGKESSLGAKKTDIEKLLKELDEMRGIKAGESELSKELLLRRLQGELDKQGSGYSYAAKTIIGGGLGSLLGPVGGAIGTAAGVAAEPATRALLKGGKAAKLVEGISKGAKETIDAATKIGAPLATVGAIGSTAKTAVSGNTMTSKMQDTEYVEKLIEEFRTSGKPGAAAYADQLEKHQQAGASDKKQIEFSLGQQPGFRELLRQYDEMKKK